MSKRKNKMYNDYNPLDVLALALDVFESQGFVRSGEGYKRQNTDGTFTEVKDNKTVIMEKIQNSERNTYNLKTAQSIMDKFNGKFMLKKMTGTLASFEKSVADSFEKDLTNFSVAIIASIPRMVEVDRKREAVQDKLETYRFTSEWFQEPRTRHEIEVEVIDVKFITSSNVYIITTVYANKDVIKFWWSDQPDISEIISGKTIRVRGTVNKHETNKHTNTKETMLNRVKIINAV